VTAAATQALPSGPADLAARHLFPALLDLTGRRVVVVGGGTTAQAKVALLLASGAAVTVVGPEVTDVVAAWADDGSVVWKRRRFRPGDVAGAFLVIAATDHPAVNTTVFAACESSATFVNAVDDIASCSTILPAVHRDGPLVVAVSTSGAAPAAAVRLREQIATATYGYGAALTLLGRYREPIKQRFATFGQRRRAWYRIVDSEAMALARSGDQAAAAEVIDAILSGEEVGS
jgi:siroheme synthase-like protein